MPPTLMKEVQQEVTDLLSDLVKIDTTNPPGNEIKAAEFLAQELKKEDFVCDLYESAPGRGSVVTRLKGSGEKPSLLLLSHLDVVAANPKEWSVDPFGGVVKDGCVWGRGALDMKGMTALEVMVIKLLKRNAVKLKGDVILAATADEEKGGEAGAGWLVQNHHEKVDAKYVINEGGGFEIPFGANKMLTVNPAEKGILWFRIKAKGRPGHGSVPGACDNAIMCMNKVVERLGNYRARTQLVPTVKEYLSQVSKLSETLRPAVDAIMANPDQADHFIDMIAKTDSYLAEEIRARMRMTVTPTIIQGGVKENIIPSECQAVFDCRVLPGQHPSDVMNEIKNLVKDIGLEKLEFEIIQANEPSESPMDTPLYGAITSVLRDFVPHDVPAPVLLTGGTDSRFFRKKGSVCYGFQPVLADIPYSQMQSTIHGIDERITVQNLVFGTSVLYNVVEKFMT